VSEPDLRRVLAVLRARRWLLVLVALPVFLVAVSYAALLPPAYQSTVVMAFTPDVDAPADETFVRLLPRYAIGATSEASLRTLETQLSLPAGSLTGAVRAELITGSLQLSFTVDGSGTEAVRSTAQGVADSVLAMAAEDEAVSARLLTGPSEPHDTSTLRRAMALAIGALVAAAAGVMVVLAVEASSPRVRLSEDLTSMGLPVLHTMKGRRHPLHTSRSTAQIDTGRHVNLLASRLRALCGQHGELSGRDARAPIYVTSVGHGAPYVAPLVDHLRRGDGARRRGQLKVAAYPPLTDPGADAPSLRGRPYVLVVPSGSRRDVVQESMALGRALGGRAVGFVLVV
jgi:hypothetical protein